MELRAERYESQGAGAPMLIAHGLFGQARNWATLAKRLSARRPAAAVDMRNHGDSPWREAMDYPTLGRDLLAAAARQFGGGVTLLGHSMGGKAAMAAALLAPETVTRLVVADIAPVAYGRHDHATRIAAMRALDLTAVSKRADAEALLAESIPEPDIRAFLLQSLSLEQTPQGRRGRWKLNLDAIAAAMPALLDWPDLLAGLRYEGPTLFLHGGASDYVTPDAQAAIRRQFPAAAIIALPGAGHWLHAEQPEAFLRALEDWLAEA